MEPIMSHYHIAATKPALKGFAASIVLSLGYQFSGVFSFINYMSDIFKASGSVVDVNTATIIIGLVQIVGVYTSTILVDIVGRRVLMLISTMGVGIGCIAFGCFTYLAKIYDLSDFNWLPLVLMIIICYVANIGLIGIFFLVLVELFPVKVRLKIQYIKWVSDSDTLSVYFIIADSLPSHLTVCDFFEFTRLWNPEAVSPDAALLGHILYHVVLCCLCTTYVLLLLALPAGNQRKVYD